MTMGSATSPSQDLFEDTEETLDSSSLVLNVMDNNGSCSFTIPDTRLPKPGGSSTALSPGASESLRTSRKLQKQTRYLQNMKKNQMHGLIRK